MRNFFWSIFIILTAMILTVSAQTATTRMILEKGIKKAQAEKFEPALVDFKNSLRLAESEDANADFRAKIHFNIGVSLYRTKRNSEAVVELEKAVKLSNGKFEKAFYALAMAQAELGNWQAAETAFHNALASNEKNGEVWFDLAFVYLAQKNMPAAQQAFQKAVEYKSIDSSIAHNNLGVILALDGDVNSAVKEFKTALKESDGKLAAAEDNLRFCKSLGSSRYADLVAKLKFES